MRKLVVWDFFFVMIHEFFDFRNFLIVEFEKLEIVSFKKRKDFIKAWAILRIIVPALVDQIFCKMRKRAWDFCLFPISIWTTFIFGISPLLNMKKMSTPNG